LNFNKKLKSAITLSKVSCKLDNSADVLTSLLLFISMRSASLSTFDVSLEAFCMSKNALSSFSFATSMSLLLAPVELEDP
jgi:hypothetical protein